MDNQTIWDTILPAIIAVITLIVAALKKMDRWIQTHRIPPEQPTATPPLARPQDAERREPVGDARTEMQREFEKALQEVEERRKEVAEEATRRLRPMPATQHPPSLPPVMHPVIQPSTAARKEAPITLHTLPASMAHHRFGHLAVLQSREDVKRALLVSEILAPPLAIRKRRSGVYGRT